MKFTKVVLLVFSMILVSASASRADVTIGSGSAEAGGGTNGYGHYLKYRATYTGDRGTDTIELTQYRGSRKVDGGSWVNDSVDKLLITGASWGTGAFTVKTDWIDANYVATCSIRAQFSGRKYVPPTSWTNITTTWAPEIVIN